MGATLGKDLITDGIKDIMHGIKTLVQGGFDWGQWLTEKAVTWAVRLISMGVSWVASKVKDWVTKLVKKCIPPSVLDFVSRLKDKIRQGFGHVRDVCFRYF